MKNEWSDSFQIKSHRSVGGQPPPFQVNKQQIFAFFEDKNERVHKFIFFWNNIFQTDEKMYTMCQDSTFQKKNPLSQDLLQSQMKILKIQTMLKIKGQKVLSKNDFLKDFRHEGCFDQKKILSIWNDFVEFCLGHTKVTELSPHQVSSIYHLN